MIRGLLSVLGVVALAWALTGCDAGGGTSSGGCGPDTCPTGCCDPATNICQTGMTQLACGMNGNLCLACTGGTTCNAQTRVCEVGTTGTCTPQTCVGGCCSAQGVCVQPGNYPTACGVDGFACKTCVGTQQCVNGQCQEYNPSACNTTNCPTGCCNGDQCQPYPNASQCGTNATPCQACPTGYTCNTQTGQCQDPNGCGATCTQQNGCCLNNQCQAGTHPLACGGGGQICDTCNQDEVCDPATKTCKPATTTGDCSPTNCFSGCCDRDGRCHIDGAINEQFCGALGLGCEICQTWEECTWGSCDPKETTCTGCGVGMCCSNGQCVPGNTTTNCGTNGAICDNCFLKLPPTTCNTTTYRCGDSTPTCSNCYGCCDSSGACLPYYNQDNTKCGTNGAQCLPCTSPSVCDTNTGQCTGSTATSYKICIDSITFNCADYGQCSAKPSPVVYIETSPSGAWSDEASPSKTCSPADYDQTLSFSWCTTNTHPLTELLAGVYIQLKLEQPLFDDHLDSCTLTFPESQIKGGSSTEEFCGSFFVTVHFTP